MQNPEIFDVCAALLLADAYKSFPVPCNVEFKKLHRRIADSFDAPDLENSVRMYLLIEHSIKWLERFGYFYIEAIRKDHAISVLLTEKGLRALRSVPASIDAERQTVADVLVEAGKAGTKEAVLRGVGALFGGVMSVI